MVGNPLPVNPDIVREGPETGQDGITLLAWMPKVSPHRPGRAVPRFLGHSISRPRHCAG